MKRKTLVLALMALGVGTSTCSNPTNPMPPIWKSPQLGSIYVYSQTNSSENSTDTAMRAPTTSLVTLLLSQTGQAIDTLTNVTRFTSSIGADIAVAYLPNGDFTVGDTALGEWFWTTYPANSHTTLHVADLDSIDVAGTRHVDQRTSRYLGEETLALGGRSYQASKVLSQSIALDSGAKTFQRFEEVDSVWWVPSLRLYAKFTTSIIINSGSIWHHLNRSKELVMYGEHTVQACAVNGN